MSKHLKTQVIEALKSSIATFVDIPATRIDNRRKSSSGRHYRGVRYFYLNAGFDSFIGALDEQKLGRKYKKRIIARHSRFHKGLFQLYTFHFPKKMVRSLRGQPRTYQRSPAPSPRPRTRSYPRSTRMAAPFLPSLLQRRQRPRKTRSRTQSLRLFLSIYLRLHLPRASSPSTRSQSPPNPAITCHNRRTTQALCRGRHLRTRLSQNQPSSPHAFPHAR